MISVYIYCKKEKDARYMTNLLSEILFWLGGEQVASQEYWIGGEEIEEDIGPTDIMIFEVTNQREFRKLLKARKKNPDAKLLILYRPVKDPGIFIRPDLCPSGLLKKPIVTAETAALFESVIRKIYKERDEEAPGRRLVVYSGSDRFLVPYSDIFYIEAKDKLLFLYHEQGKICFRDSLKRLEAVLPGSFYRIHRGVIVNLLHIRAIRLQSGKVCMMDSTVIPMSLKFRNEMERILAIWGSWSEEESEEQGQNQGKEAKNQGEKVQTQGEEVQTQGDEVENQMDLKVDPLMP